MRMWKGHGTENDFVVLPDLDGELGLTDDQVRRLCDRHAGIGADGVLRVVRWSAVPDLLPGVRPDAAPDTENAEYAMDYRNADGSVAEMCGNGVRVFARYLQHAGLIQDRTTVVTRGGLRAVRINADDTVTVGMGRPEFLDGTVAVSVPGLVSADARALTIPNPHVVVDVPDEALLRELDLSRPPVVDPALPHGQNVEFVVAAGDRHRVLRVHERGVGETRSCGTGICAVAVDAAARTGAGPDGGPWRIEVPGGTCTVRWTPDGEVELTGPAVLVAEFDLNPAVLDPTA